ncbi:winged helix-turn-helix transcriptional regulator [Streptomyces sp. NBC_00370]|uniref:winged helix-turn-helix transcriptional regulator n=1 Tax=Streptomyces sp. NBC_00370 TaxID=2975728 RepID=UPI002E26942B
MITRTVYAEVPARVEYELTTLGHTLLELIAAGRRWAEDHMGQKLTYIGVSVFTRLWFALQEAARCPSSRFPRATPP